MANKSLTEAWEEVVRAVRKRMGETVEPASVATKKVEEKGKGKAEEGVVASLDKATAVATVEGGEKRLSKRAERARKAEETKNNLPKRSMEMSAERRAALEAAAEQGAGAGGDGFEGDTEEESDDEGPIAGSEDEDLDDDEIERELAAMNEGLGSEGEWSGSENDDDEADRGGFESDASFPAGDSARPTKRSKLASLSPPPTAKKQKIREIPTHKPVTSSAFLPSLAAGYVSYSDSDGEDAKWVKAAERENKKGERKNRRGQRARQA
jgi:hypothetical protein